MKKHKYLIDTGVLARYISEDIKLSDDVLAFGCISVVTKIELYNWLNGNRMNTTQRSKALKFIKNMKIIHVNESISKMVELYPDKNLHTKVADTIIGVTALYYDLELHTGDKNDFDIFTGIRKKYYPQKKTK